MKAADASATRRGRTFLAAEIRESFAMAIASIGAHKLRSSLTLLGVLVGVFSIVVVMTALRVLQSNIESKLNFLGAHTFSVQRFPAVQVDDNPGAYERYFRRKEFRYWMAREVTDRATLAKGVGVTSYLRSGEMFSRWGKTNPGIPLIGVIPGSFETRNWVVADGRALNDNDLENGRDVCVIGSSVAKRLFPQGGALGEKIKVGGVGYTVVGVTEEKGRLFGEDQDAYALIPITTGLNRYGRERSISIQVQAWSGELYDETVEQVRGILRTARKVPPGDEDDFEITSNDSIIRQFRSLTLAVRAGAGVISSIALVAAGIGIMNIMLVSVTERTREIGIRRAIGAKKRHVMTQFVMEAVALCQIGGIGGVILGVLAGNLAAVFFQFPAVVPWDWVAIGMFVCSLVGLIFGTYPAWKAANLDPIESLRYE
ncbi:MAG: ABC transporter permease [Verrucomicrobiales bacterium]|nr:ABC transporter permease [Verrucomicrobiales bacterium]